MSYDPCALRRIAPEGTLYLYDTLPSTNTRARELVREGVRAALVIADGQSAGRGRLDRAFHSPRGAGLYMSLLFPISRDFDPAELTVRAAVATRAAIARWLPCARIKWVNDIFADAKKLCGILAEGVIDERTGKLSHAILGIGVNVRRAPLPEELLSIVTDLESEGITDLSRTELATAIVEELHRLSPLSLFAVVEEYKASALYLGERVVLYDFQSEEEATVLDILPDGSLLVRLSDGRKKVYRTGEIRIRSLS